MQREIAKFILCAGMLAILICTLTKLNSDLKSEDFQETQNNLFCLISNKGMTSPPLRITEFVSECSGANYANLLDSFPNVRKLTQDDMVLEWATPPKKSEGGSYKYVILANYNKNSTTDFAVVILNNALNKPLLTVWKKQGDGILVNMPEMTDVMFAILEKAVYTKYVNNFKQAFTLSVNDICEK